MWGGGPWLADTSAWARAAHPAVAENWKAAARMGELIGCPIVTLELLYDAPEVPTPKKTLPFFHSIGLDIIEHPSGFPAFGRLKPWELEENTVLNCEFLYFGHTLDPFHIESTFVVTADGAECFQTMPEQLRVLA